jgi:hypothetical protein
MNAHNQDVIQISKSAHEALLEAAHEDPSPKEPGGEHWARAIRVKAKNLVIRLESGYMELGKVLYELCVTPINNVPGGRPVFASWGFTSFGDYAEKELGIHRKKAERLRNIWYVIEVRLKDLPKDLRNRLTQLGSSKMRVLTRVLDVSNAAAWLDLAESIPYVQLEQKVNKALDIAKREQVTKSLESSVDGGAAALVEGTPFDDAVARTKIAKQFDVEGGAEDVDDDSEEVSENPAVTRGFTEAEAAEPTGRQIAAAVPLESEDLQFMHFAFYPDQYLTVQDALVRAQELSQSEKKSHNLSLICLDYLATNDFMGGAARDESRMKYLAKIERLLGLRLVAVDARSKEVCYGIRTLETLAQAVDE